MPEMKKAGAKLQQSSDMIIPPFVVKMLIK
jgi:hypothetical protein